MTAEGAESSAICLRTRKRVRSTTATEHPAWLATKQSPRKPVAFLWPHASAAADDNSSARREIRGAEGTRASRLSHSGNDDHDVHDHDHHHYHHHYLHEHDDDHDDVRAGHNVPCWTNLRHRFGWLWGDPELRQLRRVPDLRLRQHLRACARQQHLLLRPLLRRHLHPHPRRPAQLRGLRQQLLRPSPRG